ncbi:MAG: shikimate kinase [Blautia sp.]|nr:shikimate kinase [Blautia sp.]
MNHIAIIGFMGSGKTRVGKRLAQELGIPFVDVDKAITKKMKLTVKEIFQRFGEPFYRALETMEIKGLLEDEERKVVSLGAGLPLQEQNQKLIPQLGTVIYIKGSEATLLKRLEGTNNPLLEGENPEEKVKKLLKQRDPVYQKFADIIVETGIMPFEDFVKQILAEIEAYEKNS